MRRVALLSLLFLWPLFGSVSADMVCPDHAGVCTESPEPAASPAPAPAAPSTPVPDPMVDRHAPADAKDKTQELSEYATSYREAAEAGDPEAQYHLGTAYRWGVGVPQDTTEAAKWIAKAAEKGYPTAERVMGDLYAKGEGVPRSDTKALEWYKRAAKHKDDLGRKAMVQLENKLSK